MEAMSRWEIFLDELDWWISQHGDALVPQDATSRPVDGKPYPLGQRVKNYRLDYRRGKLTEDQIRQLEQRNGWAWSGRAGRWQRRFEDLQAYRRAHGSLDNLDANDPQLAWWLRKQRTTELDPDQRQQLEEVPGALTDRKSRLDEFLTVARSWLDANPDRTIADATFTTTHTHNSADYPLGRRIAYWRARGTNNRLTDAERTALAALPGWGWAAPTKRATDA